MLFSDKPAIWIWHKLEFDYDTDWIQSSSPIQMVKSGNYEADGSSKKLALFDKNKMLEVEPKIALGKGFWL